MARSDLELRETIMGWIDLSIDEEAVKEWIRDHFAPGDVYDEKDLIDWAESHGYYQEE